MSDATEATRHRPTHPVTVSLGSLTSGRSGAVEVPRPALGTPLDLVVDVLAAYRLTRLVTADLIGEPFRQAVVRRVGVEIPPVEEGPDPTAEELVEADPSAPRLATLVTCRWCTGVWVAAAVCAARTSAPRAWAPVGWGLALSAGAALLARAEDG
jgi:hypothetical protein